MASEITLTVNDQLYSGWKSVTVNLSIEDLSGTFSLSVTDKWAGQKDPVVIKPTDSCVLTINGQVVLTGYIDTVAPSFNANEHSITISGRDKAADLIDCSVINGTGQYKNLKIEQIIERICSPFGIDVDTDVSTGEVLKTYQIEQGMSAFEAIQRLCRARACLAMSNGAGGVLITRAGSTKLSTALIEGINIISASAVYNYAFRFSKYIVKGQQQGDNLTSVDSIAGNQYEVTDGGISRYRPLVIIADGQANISDCQTRAEWENSTRRGNSRRFTVSTVGWEQFGGGLWRVNQLVVLKSQILGVHDNLLVAGITFSLDEGGEMTTLNLVPPSAYQVLPEEITDEDGRFLTSGEQGAQQ